MTSAPVGETDGLSVGRPFPPVVEFSRSPEQVAEQICEVRFYLTDF